MMLAMVELRKWGATPTFGPRQWLRHRLIVKELKNALVQGLVLDAGCGEGRTLSLIAGMGYELSGFEYSPQAVAKAAGAAADAGLWIGSALEIPVKDQSFDAVISGDVLEHLDDDKRAVSEIFRILKPGGIAIVSVPADPSKWSIDDEWSGHKRRYTQKTLTGIFEGAGFKTRKCHTWGWPITAAYLRFFYLPMLRKKLQTTAKPSQPQGLKPSPFLNRLFSIILLPDLIMTNSPSGIGIVASFVKSPE